MKLLEIIKLFYFKIKDYFIKPKQEFKFGWVKDVEDVRDHKFTITTQHELPSLVDLRNLCPPVYDQGELGSCTANALGAAFQFEQIKQNKENFMPSRLFIYYNERAIEGSVDRDSGAMIRDGIKTMVNDGVCPESIWNYNPKDFAIKPSDECYKIASDNQVLQYMKIMPQNLYEVKHCLSDGYPIAFGFLIYESFMSSIVAKTGIAKMPKHNDKLLGGHAVLAVGYDDKKKALIVRNSWGSNWGDKGYFYLPYGYIENESLSSDFWTIRLVE